MSLNKENFYKDFFCSPIVEYLRNHNISTFELCDFVHTLIGAENFLKNHPKPVQKYYKDHPSWVRRIDFETSLTEDCNFMPTIKHKTETVINDQTIESDISTLATSKNISSEFIILHEHILNRTYLDDRWSNKCSSDDWEYYESYKSGWTLLKQNKSLKLDFALIHFLNGKIIPIRYERMGVLAGRYGDLELKESCNAIQLFREHEIDQNCIPYIINDSITWEGIFYDENFCNNSILEYVRYIIPITKVQL